MASVDLADALGKRNSAMGLHIIQLTNEEAVQIGITIADALEDIDDFIADAHANGDQELEGLEKSKALLEAVRKKL